MTATGVKFFSTTAHPCSYLEGEQAITLFADPKSRMDGRLYSELSDLGFRRSGNYVYRPHCNHCNACVPVRIPVERFAPNRQQQRVWRRNADLTVCALVPAFREDHYALYERYITERHSDGDMYPPSEEQFNSFLTSDWSDTRFYEFRAGDKLVAVAVCDVLDDGLSAVYTFFDPDEAQRSLGAYAILWEIEETRRLGLASLYLGYWIKHCQKMSYKIAYRPIELLINNEWLTAR
ncbi:MAG TPA: arginyltransferase [Moraxellaceae bacterium]|nr:arginyltransferase [Moraxellaceae bacterium]